MWPPQLTPAHTPIAHTDTDAIIIGLHGNTLIMNQHQLANADDLSALPPAEYSIVIGHLAGKAVQMRAWSEDVVLDAPLQSLALRASFDVLGEALWSLAGRASQIATFYRTHRFCGVCGAPTHPLPHEAACECSACAHRVWPRISPAVMVLIRRGREVLLARSPHFREGMYSAVAGFVEPGESLEQCAHREVLEEVGVTINNLRWFGSQSWAFPHSLMLAFIADYVAGDIICQPGEIEDARWFSLDALPLLPSSYSLLQEALSTR